MSTEIKAPVFPESVAEGTEQVPVESGRKAVQALGILTNRKVSVEGDFLSRFGQVEESGVRNIDLVTEASAFNQRLPGSFLNQYTSDTTNQGTTPFSGKLLMNAARARCELFRSHWPP